MAGLLEATRLSWCPGLSQLEGNPKIGMQDWLSKANYAPTVSGNSLILTGIDKQYVLQALAGDINKLSSAASETLRNISAVDNLPKSLGWSYVKLYYSTLFYAHSLLRIWGRSPSYLRTSDLLNLRRTVSAYGITAPFNIKTTQYMAIVDMNGPTLEVFQDQGSGGSHEAVWRDLYAGLERLSHLVTTSQFLANDKKQILEMLLNARKLLSNSGANVGWMSEMRNDINYRQGEGLWYPYAGRYSSSELCARVTSLLNGEIDFKEPLAVTGTNLQRFRAACFFVILLARGTLQDLNDVGSTNTFVKFGQLKFENALGA